MFAEAALAAWSFRWGSSQKSGSAGQIELISALAACLTVCILAVQSLCPAALWKDRPSRHVEYDDQRAAQFERRDAVANEVRYRGGEALTEFYGGAQYTYPSHVRIQRPGTDLTLHNLPWQGRPFDHPIYYGVRVAHWFPASSIGGMIDFTHSKVYSPLEEKARFSGSRNGRILPREARIADVFHKLEFTHGHNMLTLNGLWRLPLSTAFFSPYVGAGLGVSLPHSEVQLRGEHARTYEYQYTGPAYEMVLGIEFRIPRLSYFV